MHPNAEPTARPSSRYTWEDYVRLPDDDRRELIDGELVEGEMPTNLHEHIVAMLIHYLLAWVLPRRAGVVFASGFRVRVSPRRGVMPDVQYFRAGNPASHAEQGVESGRPDIAVEVISPSSAGRDRVTKLDYYASIGVPEYWIVHPEDRTFERLVLSDGKYRIDAALRDDATFHHPEMEGLEIPLATLWTLPEAPAPAT